jgi:hypothetical protein
MVPQPTMLPRAPNQERNVIETLPLRRDENVSPVKRRLGENRNRAPSFSRSRGAERLVMSYGVALA